MRALLTWIANFFIGIVGTMVIVSRLTGTGEGVRGTSSSVGVDFSFGIIELVMWLVLIFAYFWAGKKYLGQSVGGWLVAKLLGRKK